MDAADVKVIGRGSLAQALLATMAIPGVFPPVQIDGATLADGGMLNNVPADVVKGMGADVVIAIDVGNRETEDSVDALSQAGRAISVMMENAARRALVEADLLITPDLEGFGSLDWRRSDELADRGYEAASAVADELMPYALGEAEWAAWRAARQARVRDKSFVPTSLSVRGTTPELEALIRERLEPHLGDRLDFDELADDLTWVTGSEHFDRLRYEATGDNGLLIVAREKGNGPPFVRFGLDVSNEALDLAVGFKARLIALDVGKPDAEVRADVAVGTTLGAGLEYYWPFAGTRMFLAPRALAYRQTRNVFHDNELVASVRDRTAAVGADIGFTTSHSTEFRLGYQVGDAESSVAIGSLQPDGSGREISGREQLTRMRFRLDRMDAPIIPERGFRVIAAADYYLDAPESDGDFGVASAAAMVFHPLTDQDRVFGGFRGGGSFGNDAPLLYQFGLGGAFNLSSFDRERFRGQRFLYGTGGYLREVWRLPDFLGGSIYAIGFFETGTAYDTYDAAEWHGSGSAGVTMDTILGPLLVAGAFGDESSAKFYFILGDLFP
jgi:NTE family protein